MGSEWRGRGERKEKERKKKRKRKRKKERLSSQRLQIKKYFPRTVQDCHIQNRHIMGKETGETQSCADHYLQ